MRLFFAVVILAGLLIPACSVSSKADHKPITLELIKLVDSNEEVGSLLEVSIAEAQKINPDPESNPVQSLTAYYDFIDKAVELLPQEILPGPSGSVRDQMLQGICYFYFLIDQPLTELEGKNLYKNAIQYYPPFSSWLLNFANAWGSYLSTEDSWNQEIYQQIYDDPKFGLQKGWYEPASNWKTFNEFFAKYLISSDAHPIAAPDDTKVVVLPADSVPQGVWQIDESSNIQVADGLKVKLTTYYSIADLLGEESRYKDAFANGILTHTFLNVNDYHRYHFAVGGTIIEKNIISENVALEVAWNPEQGKYIPIDSTGWQFTQTRGYVIVDTGKYGLVALIPMGMAQVSSVNFEENVQVDSIHKKGDMLGNFLFGGSDFIVLFQEKAGFELTAPKEENLSSKTIIYQHALMGEEFGIMKGNSR